MGKYEKRRVFRQYRRLGIPFIVAVKLARAKGKGAWAFDPPEGFAAETITWCDCCGPELLRISKLGTDKKWDLDIWTLMPR